VQAQPLSLDEKCKKMVETIQRVATNTIGYMRKHFNEGSELEQPKRPVDLRDDGVDIDLPSREELERGAEIPEKQQGSRRGFYCGRAVEKRWT
jgi:hypothetical protein